MSEATPHRLLCSLREHPATVGFATVAGLLFCVLTVSVQTSLLQAVDESVLIAVRTPGKMKTVIGPEWLTELWCGVTRLGGYAVLTSVTVLVCLGLHLNRNLKASASFGGAVLGGYVLNVLLKAVIARPRPVVVPYLSDFDSLSFPSGHAMMSTIVFLSLGLMLSDRMSGRLMRCLTTGLAAVIAVTVGLSRICLGVHYPSDVAAGLCGGLVWTLVFRTMVWQRLTGSGTATVGAATDYSRPPGEMA